jgi:hypothetical protein
MKNSETIQGVCALVGLLIFVGMGTLLDSADPPEGVLIIGGLGLAACIVIFKLSKD